MALQQRNDTAANFASTNPVLASGEPGFENDTGLYKIGDGSTAWNSLLYIGAPTTYRMTANGSAIGAAAADFFASAAFTMASNGLYEIEWDLYFLKTTAGTVTWTIVCAQTPSNVVASYSGGPVAGIATAGAPITAGIQASAATTTTIPATSSLTDATNQHFQVRAVIKGGATAGTVKLQATESAGTITPQQGSTINVRRLPNVNPSCFA